MAKRLSHEKPFGEAVRYWRGEAGLSLRAAATELGISYTYLSKIEHGHMEPPSADVLEAIAKVYDVPRHEVFLRAKRMMPEWETQLFDPLTFYEVAKLVHNLNLPMQIKPLTVYDTGAQGNDQAPD